MNPNPQLTNTPTEGPVSPRPAAAPIGPFKPIDPVRVLRQNIWLLMTAGLIGVILGVGTWGVLRKARPRWTSAAQLRINPPIGGVFEGTKPFMTSTGGTKDMIEAFIMGEIMRIKSEEILRDAINHPAIQDTNWYKTFSGDKTEARIALDEKVLKAFMPRGTFLIDLRISTPFEDDSKTILNTVINVYQIKRNLESRSKTRKLNNTFLAERERADTTITQLDRAISAFVDQHDLESLSINHSAVGLQLQTLTQQKIDTSAMLSQLNESHKALLEESQDGSSEPSKEDLSQIELLPEIQRLSQEENALYQQLGAAQRRWGDNHTQAQGIAAQLEALKFRKKSQVDQKVRELQAVKLETTLRNIQMVKGQLNTLDDQIKEAAAEVADLQNLIDEHDQLLKQREREIENRAVADAALREAGILSSRPDFETVEIHAPPTDPELTSPMVVKVVFGVTILVLGLVTGLVFLRELVDQRVKSPMDVKLLPNIDLLGLVPNADEDPSGHGEVDRVVERHPTGLLAEAFRNVRSEIMAKMDRRGYKTLLLVSAQPGCGTSTVAHNLASSLVLNGRKVVVVDANFRRPDQHRLMDADNSRGLVDVLLGKASLDDVLHKSEASGLALVTAGNCSNQPPELLESANFRNLLGELERQFDIVVIDAAPALLTSDSQFLAKHIDAIAMVVRASNDTRGMVSRMKQKLDGHRADLLGVILNDVRSSIGGYFRKNYEQFYSYSANGANDNGLNAARQRKAAKAMEIVDTPED